MDNAYGPRGAAYELFFAREQEVLLEGPAGTGKSRAVLEKVFLCAMKYPRMRALLVRKTRASMSQSVLVTFEEKVLPPGHALLDGPTREYRQTYRLDNGSEIVIGGLDNADRIMSTEYDLIAVFEATEATQEDWEKLTTRLRNGVMPYQQAIADCNPGPPSHWLNMRARQEHMRRLLSRHEDNPAYWNPTTAAWTPLGAQYIATLDRLAGVRHKRLRLGHWAAAEGLVYPTLLENVVATPDGRPLARLPSPALRVAAGMDWGWTDPLAAVVGAFCQDGRLYIIDELYGSKIPPDELQRRVQALRRMWNINIFYCDPNRADLIAMLRRVDIHCVPNHTRMIDVGIARVEALLPPAADRLKICSNCTNLLREAGEYEYTQRHDGSFRSVPADACNHAMDALRYLVCGMNLGMDDPTPDESADDAGSREAALRRLGHTPPTAAEVGAMAQRAQQERFRRMAWGP
jgi:PBSX family phage terminase large subunit